MGITTRPKPRCLPEKLLHIRLALGLSQNEMLKRLQLGEGYFRSSISGYELGTREPPLPILLKYARIAGVYVDALIDDTVDLPERLPASSKYEWALRRIRRH
jgi:transcriptional regulator with XRE-family HTH domain